jgi:GrpB-like predicted nucleotidyltransferase (UPF0157 family)
VCGLAAVCPVVLGHIRRRRIERQKAQLIWISRRSVAKLDPDFTAAHALRLAPRVGRLLFRDYLRAHGEIVEKYEQIKKELAHRYRENREAYTEGKAAFIEGVLKAARSSGADAE